LTLTALARAKFCEQAATRIGLGDAAADGYFLMGLFSVLDAMLGQPLEQALEEVPLAADSKAALLGQATSVQTESLWHLALACESADAEAAARLCRVAPLRPELSAQMWTNALSWSNSICTEIAPR
jgi:c-di-GMP-related signal transduction protein